MIIEFFIDKFFILFDFLWMKFNFDLSFLSDLVNIASNHLDTVINVLKTVLFIVPSGVLTLIPFVFLLIGIRLVYALFWFIMDFVNDIPVI